MLDPVDRSVTVTVRVVPPQPAIANAAAPPATATNGLRRFMCQWLLDGSGFFGLPSRAADDEKWVRLSRPGGANLGGSARRRRCDPERTDGRRTQIMRRRHHSQPVIDQLGEM